MKKLMLVGGATAFVALVLSGCSSSPTVGDVETDGLIAACLDGATPIAQDSNTHIEGPVSNVATDGDEVAIVFDARDENDTADPAQCTLIVSGDKVTAFDLGAPDSDPGTAVEGAVERWNDKHAEDWSKGKGPDPVQAPSPDAGSSESPY